MITTKTLLVKLMKLVNITFEFKCLLRKMTTYLNRVNRQVLV